MDSRGRFAERPHAAAGLSFNAKSEKALAASKSPSCRVVLDVGMIGQRHGWSVTPSTNLLYGLREAIAMLEEKVARSLRAQRPPRRKQTGAP